MKCILLTSCSIDDYFVTVIPLQLTGELVGRKGAA
jgi:hypothetical protein